MIKMRLNQRAHKLVNSKMRKYKTWLPAVVSKSGMTYTSYFVDEDAALAIKAMRIPGKTLSETIEILRKF